MSKTEAPKGKLTYCVPCKAYTETILYTIPGPIPLLKIGGSTRRVCVNCGKTKIMTRLETDEPTWRER